VKGILADVNIQKYVHILVAIMQSEDYKLFWDHLQIQYLQFADVGLPSNALDTLIWQTCRQRELVLITDNRNQDDDSSRVCYPLTQYIAFAARVHDIEHQPSAQQPRIPSSCRREPS